MTIRVAVVGGGQNCEHDVSIATAASVRGALDRDKYDAVTLTIERDGSWSDASGDRLSLAAAVDVLQGCDVVFPAAHGPRAEDGTLAALCELAGVRYVGSGVRAGAIAMDKWATKLVAEAVGIPSAQGILVSPAHPTGHPPSVPVVVKPVSAGSSFGVQLVTDPGALDGAIADSLGYDDRVLVEERVIGREVDVAVVRRANGSHLVGPPLEIVATGLFDTDTKYDGSADFRIPADLDDVVVKQLQSAAIEVFVALGCRGVARIDFFVTDAGLVFNEANTMPGLTEHSQVPQMFAAMGLPYAELLHLLIEDALAPTR